jgi:hypothetical protein
MMSQQKTPGSVARPPRWRFFLQFSVRSLLILMTAAAALCWWFLKPQNRIEPLGYSLLQLRREVRLVKVDPTMPHQFRQVQNNNGQQIAVINAGQWRVFNSTGDLLVNGNYAHDKPHGKWTVYHVNGRKAVEGRMVSGRKVGRWRAWDEEGRLVSDHTYTDSEQRTDNH